MEEAGREVDPADYPPELHWEGVVWWLFQRIRTQWRVGGGGGLIGLDYNPAIALMQSLGWPLGLGLELLQAIEVEMMRQDATPTDT